MGSKDVCPKCGLASETLAGLSYPCGSYYTWGGFTQTALCRTFAENKEKAIEKAKEELTFD